MRTSYNKKSPSLQPRPRAFGSVYTIGMICAKTPFRITLLLITAPALLASGDTVKLFETPAFENVHVVGVQRGRLVFRGVSREYLRKPLDQVEWIETDSCPPLGVAERATAAGDWDGAIAAYEQARAEARETWLRELIELRLLSAYDGGGRFDDAVALYAEVLTGEPDLVARRPPRHPDAPGSAANRRARAHLRAALAADPPGPVRESLRTLLLEVLIYEDAGDLPAGLGARGPPATTKPARRSPLLGLPVAPRRKVEPPRLSADSFLLAAAETALDAGEPERAFRLVERGMPFVPPAEADPWRLLLSRARIALGEPIAATDDLLRLSESATEPAVATAALYYLGVAHERMERPDVAQRLYRELLGRPDVPDAVRADAAAALKRLGE